MWHGGREDPPPLLCGRVGRGAGTGVPALGRDGEWRILKKWQFCQTGWGHGSPTPHLGPTVVEWTPAPLAKQGAGVPEESGEATPARWRIGGSSQMPGGLLAMPGGEAPSQPSGATALSPTPNTPHESGGGEGGGGGWEGGPGTVALGPPKWDPGAGRNFNSLSAGLHSGWPLGPGRREGGLKG